jgi:hypothetical protein
VHLAHAQAAGVINTFLGHGLFDLLAEIAAWVSNMALQIMSLWVMLTGALLNVSISMTLHIKDFVDSTQGVYLVWQTVRDISGMFIIFLLLYASIKIILGFDSVGGVGNLIKNIVIVGILINFSFFITSLLIDASNIVSLALYNGIVGNPTAAQKIDTANALADAATKCGQPAGTVNSCVTVAAMTDSKNISNGGMSAIFLNILAPQSIYNPANKASTDAANSSYSKDQAAGILIQGIIGSVIMFTIGLSFLLASLAFVVRLLVLVFLLAFSPIWFASWVIPGLDEKAKEFTNQLKAQLVFMPVYLLLLYAALRVAAGSTVFTNLNTNSLGTDSLTAYTVLLINDLFIVFLLNIPLVVAFSMGGVASKYIKADKFNAAAIWKGIGSSAGRNTLGRGAHIARNSAVMNKISSMSPSVGASISNRLGKVENYGFGQKKGGFKDKNDAKQKSYKAEYDRLSKVDETKYNDTIKDVNGDTALDRARAAAKVNAEAFARNVSKGSIFNSLVNSAAKGTANVGATVVHKAANASMGIIGKNNAVSIDNIGKQIAGSIASAPNTLGMNVGGRKAGEVINRERKKAQTKEEAKKAKDERDKETAAYNKSQRDQKDQMDLMTAQMEELAKEEAKTNDEINELNEAIEKDRGINNLYAPMGRPSTTAVQEKSLAEVSKKLEEIKTKKIAIEKQRSEISEKMKKETREHQDKKQEWEKKINAGKEVEEQEKDEKIMNKLDALEKKGEGGGEKSSGGDKKEEKK